MSVTPAFLDDVHEFWFGTLDGPEAKAPEKAKIWFEQSNETDQLIRGRFGAAVEEAAAADWNLDPLTRTQKVGLVVLLDQFPRNIHRTTGNAYAHDDKVLGIADRLIASGLERFYIVERIFVILPVMHSERVADQDRCAMLLAEQALTVPDDWKEDFRYALDMGTKHRDLIRRFGRYPHRNEMLGRESTEEEAAFLAEHGRGF
jgi:uncharacterized protein (DUF924 family)